MNTNHFDAREEVRNYYLGVALAERDRASEEEECRRRKMGWLAWTCLCLCIGVALIWGLW